MKLTITTDALRAALAVAEKVVGKDRQLPILNAVLLEATEDGTLTVTGTDLRTSATREVAALVEEPGAVCLPPRAVNDVLAAVPSGSSLSIDASANHRATLACGRTVVKVTGFDPDDYPPIPSLGSASVAWTMPSDLLRAVVGSVAFAAAVDEARPTLAGILVTIRDGVISLQAADGARIAYRSVPLDGAPDLVAIVTADRLQTIANALPKTGTVRLSVTETGSHLGIETPEGRWSIKLLEGTYPNLSKARRIEATTRVTVDRSALLRAARLVSTVSTAVVGNHDRTTATTKAILTISQTSLEIRAGEDGADHEAVTEIDADLELGDPIALAVNSKSLRDALEALTSERVTLEHPSGLNLPLLVRATDEPDRTHVHLLFQMVVANVATRVAGAA